MSTGIDPRAIVDPSARIGENVEISGLEDPKLRDHMSEQQAETLAEEVEMARDAAAAARGRQSPGQQRESG